MKRAKTPKEIQAFLIETFGDDTFQGVTFRWNILKQLFIYGWCTEDNNIETFTHQKKDASYINFFSFAVTPLDQPSKCDIDLNIGNPYKFRIDSEKLSGRHYFTLETYISNPFSKREIKKIEIVDEVKETDVMAISANTMSSFAEMPKSVNIKIAIHLE